MRCAVFFALFFAACTTSEPDRDAGSDFGVDAPLDAPHDVPTDASVEGGDDGSVCPDGYWLDRPAYDRACTTDTDCRIAFWWTSCCTARASGIAASAYDAFTAVNDACDAHAWHDCGCPMYATADDGAMVIAIPGPTGVTARCDAHVCVTSASCAGSVTCAGATSQCAPTCSGAGVAMACMAPLPTCDGGTTCACLAAADASPCGSGTCADRVPGTYTCACP